MSTKQILCPICMTGWTRVVHYYRGNSVYRCQRCNLDFCSTILEHQDGYGDCLSTNTPESILDGYYSNFAANTRVSTKSLSQRFPFFEAAFGKDIKTVCEIGCGPGTAYNFFKMRGIKWIGLEADPVAIQHGLDHNIPIYNLGISEIDYKFDLIYFHQVLEHIWEPVNFLNAVREKLNDGGIVAIGVPNHSGFTALFRRAFSNIYKSEFGMLQFPHHLRAYSQKSLRVLLENNGFDVEMIKPVRSTQLLWGEWYEFKGSVLSKFIFEFGSRVGLGTLLYAYAKKLG
jgi:SAM-dependent methyltransferase